MTEISVLMPVRDGEAFVERGARSVLSQTHRTLELVIVDDGSTDATASILERLAKKDARVRIVTQPRRGLVAALNRGLEACRAPVIARMDCDDEAVPRRFAVQLELLNRGYDLIGARVEIVGGGEGFAHYAAWQNALLAHDDLLRERFIECPLAHPTFMMRRSLVDTLDGYAECSWPEDYDFVLRACAAGARLGKSAEVLLRWHDRADRTSRRDPRYGERAFVACKGHHLSHWLRERDARAWLWGAGKLGRALGRVLLNHGVHLEGYFDVDPNKIGRNRRGLPVRSPDALRPEPGAVLIGAVGARGVREQIRTYATARGFREGVDFFCAA